MRVFFIWTYYSTSSRYMDFNSFWSILLTTIDIKIYIWQQHMTLNITVKFNFIGKLFKTKGYNEFWLWFSSNTSNKFDYTCSWLCKNAHNTRKRHAFVNFTHYCKIKRLMSINDRSFIKFPWFSSGCWLDCNFIISLF